MTTSSIGCTTTGFGSVSTAQVVDQLFKKVDSNSDGKITKSELTQAVESDTVEISSSGREMSVDEVFNLLDTGNKGYVTKQDAANALSQTQSNSGDASAAGGASRPAGGGGGGGGGGSSVSATTDPADTNGDGTVSLSEEIAYLLKQYTQGEPATESQSEIYA